MATSATAERKVGITVILKDKMSASLRKTEKAAEDVARAGKKIQKSFKRMMKLILPVSAAFTAMSAVSFILTKRVSEFGDQMIKGAQRLNLTTTAFQRLDHAMQLSGTSMQEQRGALTRFARTARDAVNGVKIAEEAFTRLGVSVRKQDGSYKQTEELIYDVSDAFSKMPMTVEKSALMMDLFGRSGAQMAQFLNLGSEALKEVGHDAERLGGIMSEDAAKQSEKFIDALTRLDLAADGVTRAIGGSMQPVFTRMMEAMANSVVKLRRVFAPVFESIRDDFKATADVLVPVVGFIIKAFVGFGTAVVLAFKAITFTINKRLAEIVDGMNDLIEGANRLGERFGIAIEPIANVFADTRDQIKEDMLDIGASSLETMNAIDAVGDAITNSNKKIYTTADAVDEARKSTEELGNVSKDLTDEELKQLEKRRKANADYYAKIEKMAEESRQRNFERQVAITNSEAEAHDEYIRKQLSHLQDLRTEAAEMVEEFARAGSSIGNAFIQGFEAASESQDRMVEGLKSAAQESIMIGLDVMEQQVINYAKTAAAAAASSTASIPVIGPAMAAAAAAAMFALVKGFIHMGFNGMAEGGLVTGGVANRDSVPTMLMPGEFVLTKKQTDSLRQGGGGGLGSSTINIELSSSLPPSRAEMKKFVRQNIVPALRELRAQRMF